MTAIGEKNAFDLLLVALRFNEKINQQDLEGLAELMADDYTFINNSGGVTKGKDVNKQGWKQFFTEYPDYKNIFTATTVQDDTVVMVGYSTCSYKRLNGPNIWTAKNAQRTHQRMESNLARPKITTILRDAITQRRVKIPAKAPVNLALSLFQVSSEPSKCIR